MLSVLMCILSFSPATVHAKENRNSKHLESGTYHSMYKSDIELCNQTIDQYLNLLLIYYIQPCSLSETELVCNSKGDCSGRESNEKIYVRIIHNNHYRWENITENYGGSFLLNECGNNCE